jgi:TonB family protein
MNVVASAICLALLFVPAAAGFTAGTSSSAGNTTDTTGTTTDDTDNLMAAEVDDGDGSSLGSLLAASRVRPLGGLSMGGRALVRITDERGLPLPFAAYRVLRDGRELAHGIAYADGAFPLYGIAPATRLELSCRGSASALALEAGTAGQTEKSISLAGARGLAEPLPCDLVFVVDATVSMADSYKALRDCIAEVVSAAEAAKPALALRIGAVLFKDYGEDFLVRSCPLGSDPRKALDLIGRAIAGGGGDVPEALGAGLREAVDGMDYAPDGLKLVFAFTDAPPKDGSAAGKESCAAACKTALEKGVKIYTVGMRNPPPETEYPLREIALYTRAAYLASGLGSVATPASPASPASPGGVVRGRLAVLLSRIVAGEVGACAPARGLAAPGGAASSRDPALDMLDRVQRRIAAASSYPEAARLRGIEGQAVVEMRTDARGALVESRIASSSGSSILDRAALDLVRAAFPVENPTRTEAELEITIRFSLGG